MTLATCASIATNIRPQVYYTMTLATCASIATNIRSQVYYTITLATCASICHSVLLGCHMTGSCIRQVIEGWLVSEFTCAPVIAPLFMCVPQCSHVTYSTYLLSRMPWEAKVMDKKRVHTLCKDEVLILNTCWFIAYQYFYNFVLLMITFLNVFVLLNTLMGTTQYKWYIIMSEKAYPWNSKPCW